MTLACAVVLLAVPSHFEVLQVEQRQMAFQCQWRWYSFGGSGWRDCGSASTLAMFFAVEATEAAWQRQWRRGSGSGTRTCLAGAMVLLSSSMLQMARQRVAQLQKH